MKQVKKMIVSYEWCREGCSSEFSADPYKPYAMIIYSELHS